jgi:hypothetical protein
MRESGIPFMVNSTIKGFRNWGINVFFNCHSSESKKDIYKTTKVTMDTKNNIFWLTSKTLCTLCLCGEKYFNKEGCIKL